VHPDRAEIDGRRGVAHDDLSSRSGVGVLSEAARGIGWSGMSGLVVPVVVVVALSVMVLVLRRRRVAASQGAPEPARGL
jgi:hypothetical protein